MFLNPSPEFPLVLLHFGKNLYFSYPCVHCSEFECREFWMLFRPHPSRPPPTPVLVTSSNWSESTLYTLNWEVSPYGWWYMLSCIGGMLFYPHIYSPHPLSVSNRYPILEINDVAQSSESWYVLTVTRMRVGVGSAWMNAEFDSDLGIPPTTHQASSGHFGALNWNMVLIGSIETFKHPRSEPPIPRIIQSHME